MERLAVVDPTAGSLVDAAAEAEPVSLAVGDDAHLLVVDTEGRCRSAIGQHGNGHCYVEVLLRDHPGQGFQAVASREVGWHEGHGGKVVVDLAPEVVTLLNGPHLFVVQGAADDEAHTTAIGDQFLDATRGLGESGGREIARHAVVMDGGRKGRHIEQGDQVAVLVAVAGFPGMPW
jgi:hypothetical protein